MADSRARHLLMVAKMSQYSVSAPSAANAAQTAAPVAPGPSGQGSQDLNVTPQPAEEPFVSRSEKVEYRDQDGK